MKKRSTANTDVIATLFPSIGSSTKRKKQLQFNPFNECVAVQQQRQKKATNPAYSKGRSKTLTVVVLKHILKTIPKKDDRDDLRKEGRIKDLAFHRIMSCNEVQMLVLQAFRIIKLENYEYLKCRKDSSLIKFDNQMLDANGLIMLAGSGCLYLHELSSTATCSMATCTVSTTVTSTSTCITVTSTVPVAISTPRLPISGTRSVVPAGRYTLPISTVPAARVTHAQPISTVARPTLPVGRSILPISTVPTTRGM